MCKCKEKQTKNRNYFFGHMYEGFSFLTSLKSLVNVLMISTFCRLSNISLLTTPKQKNHLHK